MFNQGVVTYFPWLKIFGKVTPQGCIQKFGVGGYLLPESAPPLPIIDVGIGTDPPSPSVCPLRRPVLPIKQPFNQKAFLKETFSFYV